MTSTIQSSRRVGSEIACCVALILSQSALAQPQRFDIPETDAVRTIQEFARQAGLQIVAPADELKGVKTAALKGELESRTALRRLLVGTGLEIASDDGALITLRKVDVPAPFRTSALDVAPAQPDETELEEVVVTSKIVFTQNDAFGATKMGLSLKDTPQTVTVITADLVQASGIKTFNDLYKLDASGGGHHEPGNYQRNYYRGFTQGGSQAVRVDGFRMPGWIMLDFATFDRFELIKGPTSTLYGQNSVGGMLNLVSKLPQKKFGADLALETGSFNAYRVDADFTGPIGSSEAWSYRVIGAYGDEDSYIDFGFREVKLLSSSLQFDPDENTRFILRATWEDMGTRQNFGPVLQLAGNGTGTAAERALSEGLQIPDLPRSLRFGMPWTHQDSDAGIIQFQGEHTFANDWRLRGHAQYTQSNVVNDAFAGHGPLDENGFSYTSYAYGGDADNNLYGAEVNLFGKVGLFGREHTLFVGADYSHIRTDSRFGYQGFTYGWSGSLINVFNPDYTTVPRFDMSDYAYLSDYKDENELYGATVQLILNPADRVKVLLGGRYSVDTILSRSRSGEQDTIDAQSYEKGSDLIFHNFTLQTGVTYQATDRVNLYASYGETFEPKTARLFVADGEPGKLIAPEEGTSYEIGAKADLTKDLAFTMAVFQMERSNIAERDLGHIGFSLPLGTQRSRGVELGAQGRVAPPVNVYASVAYLDAEFSDGEFKGLQPAGAPRFGASVFGSYEFLEGGLKGLGFGLGVVYKTGLETFDSGLTRAAGEPVTFDFGSFTEVDARLFYGRDRWSFVLAGTNLFNEKYYSAFSNYLSGGTGVNPPRAWKASVRYKF